GGGGGGGRGPGGPGGRGTEPLIRDGGELRPVSWERAIDEAIQGLRRAGSRTGAVVGGQATNEEGFLLARVLREGLGSAHVDSRAAGARAPRHQRGRPAAPPLAAGGDPQGARPRALRPLGRRAHPRVPPLPRA